jgi:hypothetical protein
MHPCPIRACAELVDDAKLLCRTHWRLVPALLQAAVYRTWFRMRRVTTAKDLDDARRAFEHARDAAIDHVNNLEGA